MATRTMARNDAFCVAIGVDRDDQRLGADDQAGVPVGAACPPRPDGPPGPAEDRLAPRRPPTRRPPQEEGPGPRPPGLPPPDRRLSPLLHLRRRLDSPAGPPLSARGLRRRG